MALTDEQKQTVTDLRQIFRSMDADAAQQIRDAYYKTMDGLRTMVELLEVADAIQDESAGPLFTEHILLQSKR